MSKKSGGKKKAAKAKNTTATGRGKNKKKAAKAEDTAPTGPERLYEFADQVAVEDAGDEAEAAGPRFVETWVTFTLAAEHFAVRAGAVQEILRVTSITRVPHAPYTVSGIINVRGRAVPVIDLRTRLGIEESDLDDKSRVLVTNTRGRLLGLLVDSAEKVVGLDRDAVEPVPGDVATEQSDYIIGVQRHEGQLLILLDVAQVLILPDSLEAVNAGRK